MNPAHHADSCRRHDALCRASALDRRDFSENAHPDSAQPRARRARPTHSASGGAAESRIFAYEAGTHIDRAAPGTLPLVGKTSRGASVKPCTSETNDHGVMEGWSIGAMD